MYHYNYRFGTLCARLLPLIDVYRAKEGSLMREGEGGCIIIVIDRSYTLYECNITVIATMVCSDFYIHNRKGNSWFIQCFWFPFNLLLLLPLKCKLIKSMMKTSQLEYLYLPVAVHFSIYVLKNWLKPQHYE